MTIDTLARRRLALLAQREDIDAEIKNIDAQLIDAVEVGGHIDLDGQPGDGGRAWPQDGDTDGLTLLPTPATVNSKSTRAMTASTGNGRRSGGGQSSPPGLEEVASVISGDWPDHMPAPEDLPPATVALLPTPAVNDMGRGKTVEDWDEWTAAMRERHGNGNGHGKSLEIEAQRLLPTARATRGGSSTEISYALGGTYSDDTRPQGVVSPGTDFGPYAAAIHRWEQVLGRPAPSPTEPGRDGRQRLSPRFVEWMMGLPAGHVTDTGIPRNAQLKALGNGVVPQQAALALSMLLPRLYGGEAGAVAVADDVRLLPTPTASLAGGEPAPWKPGVQWWRQSRATRNLAGIVTGNTPEWEGGST